MLLRCFTSHGSHSTYPTAYRHMCFTHVGFPIRTSPDQSLFTSSPKRFVGYHVLHRLIVPRHPPYTLLCFNLKDYTEFLTSNLWSPSCDDANYFFTPLNSQSEYSTGVDAMFTLMQSPTLKVLIYLQLIHILICWISECVTTIQFEKCLVAQKV